MPAAELVKLRFFAGLSMDEAAEILGIPRELLDSALGLRPGVALGRALSDAVTIVSDRRNFSGIFRIVRRFGHCRIVV